MTAKLPFPASPLPRSRGQAVPRPPAHLKADGAALWRDVQREYAVDEGHQRALLQAACEARDRQAQARELIEKEGLIVRSERYGPRSHPAVAIERDARTSMTRCLRELGLDLVRDTAARPPSRWS